MQSNSARIRRIAVVGGRAVGKSSMTIQFVEGHFADNYYPTIENAYRKSVRYHNQEYQVDIVDTAGQVGCLMGCDDEYSILPSNLALGIHGYVLVFSITSRSTFDMLSVIRDKILNASGMNSVPIVIVGNKQDLQSQRQIQAQEAKSLAAQWNCAYVETSAKKNENLDQVFESILGEIERSNGASREDKKSGCIVS